MAAADEQRRTDLVLRSAQVSTVAQVFLGLYSLIGFIKVPDESSNLLWVLLVLDTIVQVVELAFYVVFIFVRQLDVFYRYFDWFLTTPIMLISTMMFLEYLHDRRLTVDAFASGYANEIVFVVLMNSIMLAFGFCAERLWIPPWIALPLGWVPFVLVFVLIYGVFGYKTPGGIVLLTFVCVVWALYGVAAFLETRRKTVMYNVLDIFSKNLYGVVVATYLIAEN